MSILHDAISALTSDYMTRIANLKERADLIEELERTFKGADNVDLSVIHGVSISHSGDKKSLAAVLRKVRKLGFTWDKERIPKEPRDYLTIGCYRGEVGNNRRYLTISFSSKVCERVKVGEREVTRIEPIYEMRCK